jgi:hypothetical protein
MQSRMATLQRREILYYALFVAVALLLAACVVLAGWFALPRQAGSEVALPLAGYAPGGAPYRSESGDFWLVHTEAGRLFAFVPFAPEYKSTVGVEECPYTWSEPAGRFVDPCSGDEWELDGRLNLAHSTELWSHRDLDRYATTVEEEMIIVRLDETITGTVRVAED